MMKNYLTITFLVLFTSISAQTLWDADVITFTKDDAADWTLEENQDRITDNVWITRQNQWSIFNIAEGDISTFTACDDNGDNGSQPLGTEWAKGSIADGIETLTFGTFLSPAYADCGFPDSILNEAGVLHLIEDDIYIDITFTSWAVGGDGGLGGFSYERASGPTLGLNEISDENISMYPNPANNQITFPILDKEMSYEIFNLLGEKVSAGIAKRNEPIAINTLTNGVYFIRLDQEITKKFIKK